MRLRYLILGGLFLVILGVLCGYSLYDRDEGGLVRVATYGLTNVTKVRDGDTICVRPYWLHERCLRFVGVDTPESTMGHNECYGQEASNYVKQELEHHWVWVTFDTRAGMFDKYHRVLAYVYTWNGTLLNRELIRLGYAEETGYGHRYERQPEFQIFEQEARSNLRGRWGVCGLSKKHHN